MNKRNTSIQFRGINTTIPDFTVPDGACEELNNLRFRDNAWQGVGNFQTTLNEPTPSGADVNTFKLLHIHEVDGTPHYVCVADADPNEQVDAHLYVYVNNWLDLGSFGTSLDVQVSSFGNVLIVTSEDTMKYYMWNDDTYTLFQMPTPVTIYKNTTTQEEVAPNHKGNNGWWWYLLNDAGEILQPTTREGTDTWWGEVCFLVAYRMKDGTIISPSPLNILCSEESGNVTNLYVGPIEVENDRFIGIYSTLMVDYLPHLRKFRPKVLVRLPDENIDTSYIDRVAIYCTRINSIPDYAALRDAFIVSNGLEPYSRYYADNKLPTQPLYLLAEEYIENIENRSWEVDFGYNQLKDISTIPQLYEASQLHSIVAETTYDYNHRIHFGGVTSTLYPHPSALTANSSQDGLFQEFITLDGVGSVYSRPIRCPDFASAGQEDSYPTITGSDGEVVMNTPILSYPDYRASTLRIYNKRDALRNSEVESIPLTPAVANNFAYYIPPTDGVLKYPRKTFVVDTRTICPTAEDTFSELNRIQVSAIDNPFSLPFNNSYAVGNEGSKVLAMNTVADSLADSTFYGNFPLYIFTTDGIFALRAGSGEILYAGTEIVNHDSLINPTTIALNGSVVYACSEGLKALSGRNAVRISADIDTNIDGWLDWSRAQFAINWRYGELLCKKQGGELWVWNIANGVWTTRDVPQGVNGEVCNGHFGVVVDGELWVYDLNHEEDGTNTFRIFTRPLKFESTGFKQIETMLIRLRSLAPEEYTIRIDVSNNSLDWKTIKATSITTDTFIGLRRLYPSARFFRITISGNADAFFRLSHIDFTLQDRYNYKLR